MKEIRDPEKLESVFVLQKDHFQKRPPVLRLLSFEKGELLNHPLKPLSQFLILIEGSVCIYHLSPDGAMRYLTRASSGTLLGDMEFSQVKGNAFYTEATEEVLCLAIPFAQNQDVLENDPVFLRFVLSQIAGKLSTSSTMDIVVQTLEEKVLFYLRTIQSDHEFASVNKAMQALNCSRRQLQHVLKKLCDEGTLIKTGRGHYRLASFL